MNVPMTDQQIIQRIIDLRNELRNGYHLSPYQIGRNLYREGKGVSDIWSAVAEDTDMDECLRGYEYEKSAMSVVGEARGMCCGSVWG
jgi:hypothetical protein